MFMSNEKLTGVLEGGKGENEEEFFLKSFPVWMTEILILRLTI